MTKPGDSDRPEGEDRPAAEETAAPETAAARPAVPPSRPPTEPARPPKKQRPVMPTAREAAAERGAARAPRSVRWGFYLVVASVVVAVFGGVFLLLNKDTLVDNALEFSSGEPLTRAQAEQSVTNGLWVFLVINVLFGVLQVLFAYKAQHGVRRARMLVTIVTVMVVLFHYLLVPTLFGQLAGMVAAIATALMYLPAARGFFPPRQTVR